VFGRGYRLDRLDISPSAAGTAPSPAETG